MSILIKGLDMPKDDSELLCIEIWPDGQVSMDLDLSCEPVATAVEVPTPHGRLIDAAAIPFVQSEDGCPDDYAYRYDINELPTVIKAEEGEG